MSCTSISIPNGYTHSGVNLFNVNDTVTYTCNTFYTLSGNAVASCLNVNGTWSSIPSCKLVFYDNGMYLYIFTFIFLLYLVFYDNVMYIYIFVISWKGVCFILFQKLYLFESFVYSLQHDWEFSIYYIGILFKK